jgi:hypothetical protein
MSDASREWLKTYLAELETAGNKLLTQIYEDENGIPSTVVGGGSIGLAGYALATQISVTTADPDELVNLVVEHRAHAEKKLGPDAWPDVAFGALLHLACLYLEPAYRVTDTTDVDLRGAAQQWWQTFADAIDANPEGSNA